MFPLQARRRPGGVGDGLAGRRSWSSSAVVTVLTVLFTRGFHWQVLSPGDAGAARACGPTTSRRSAWRSCRRSTRGRRSTCRSPCPRASVTQAADDLKARDALLRGFPEVESVIGKAGRADTPTDPAPLDMVETFVNFRPEGAVAEAGAEVQGRRDGRRGAVLAGPGGARLRAAPPPRRRPRRAGERRRPEGPGAVRRGHAGARPAAATRSSSANSARKLTRFAVAETVRRFRIAGDLRSPGGGIKEDMIEELTERSPRTTVCGSPGTRRWRT